MGPFQGRKRGWAKYWKYHEYPIWYSCNMFFELWSNARVYKKILMKGTIQGLTDK